MIIKKIKDSEIQIDSLRAKTNIIFNEEQVIIKTTLASNEIDISTPGEYEYDDVNITALDVLVNEYKRIINFVKVSVDNINIGLVLNNITFDKEIFKDLGILDVLVISSSVSIDLIKKSINQFDPLFVGILNATNIEQIKKDLSISNINEEKQIKLKLADLVRSEETLITYYSLVK